MCRLPNEGVEKPRANLAVHRRAGNALLARCGRHTARDKYIDTNPGRIPVDLAKQLLPGTIERAVHRLLEHELDLSGFDAWRRRHDRNSARTNVPVFDPFAYSIAVPGSKERIWLSR